MKESFDNDEVRTFELLRRAKSGSPFTGQAAQMYLAKQARTGKKAALLVVDDSEQLRNLVVLNLQALGYENVSAAADGLIAMEMLARQDYDLMLLDIDMPRMNGFEVLAAIRRDPQLRHLPVIVGSGMDQLDAIVRCIELGAEDFLPKPVNAVILNARISASLERKRLRDLEQIRLIEVEEEKLLLNAEKEKSERLLLNILPRVIAERLKQGEYTIAERYPSVTVLFADLVDFSLLANSLEPEQLVSLLNDLFSRFDQLATQYGLEKIKTIGDSYLVVGGLPEAMPNHTEKVAEMALGMLRATEDLNRARGTSLSLRIGLNTGPVVAGVIGRRKFTYDLWGVTVNVASRMQSGGVSNRIHLPAATAALLQDKFNLTKRGNIFCKGLGDITTYLLDGKKA